MPWAGTATGIPSHWGRRRLLRVNGVWCGRVVVLQVLKCHSVFTHLDNVTARLRLVVPVYLAPSANGAPKNAQRVGHRSICWKSKVLLVCPSSSRHGTYICHFSGRTCPSKKVALFFCERGGNMASHGYQDVASPCRTNFSASWMLWSGSGLKYPACIQDWSSRVRSTEAGRCTCSELSSSRRYDSVYTGCTPRRDVFCGG